MCGKNSERLYYSCKLVLNVVIKTFWYINYIEFFLIDIDQCEPVPFFNGLRLSAPALSKKDPGAYFIIFFHRLRLLQKRPGWESFLGVFTSSGSLLIGLQALYTLFYRPRLLLKSSGSGSPTLILTDSL